MRRTEMLAAPGLKIGNNYYRLCPTHHSSADSAIDIQVALVVSTATNLEMAETSRRKSDKGNRRACAFLSAEF